MEDQYIILKEKHTRLSQALSIVGSLVLPLEDEARVLDVISEQLIRAARIRSLLVALVYRDRGYVDIVRTARFNKLTSEGHLTEESIPRVERINDWREEIYNSPKSFICRTVREGTTSIIDGNHKDIDDDRIPAWRNKVSYFVRLQHGDEPIAILAGACALDEADNALDWTKDIEPLTDLATAQIKTLRILKEQRFLAYRPPTEANLSTQEIEVLRRVALGESATQIAEEMDLSPRTVHTYKRRICKKLDRYSQADLTRYAIMTGLIPLTDR